MDLWEKVVEGDTSTIARLITLAQEDPISLRPIITALYPFTGKSYRIGITGPPGVGKSTLINKLAGNLLEKGYSIGIIAIDPTSPFTGGAFLGDRLRMQELIGLEGKVFIRSLATRGISGGLSKNLTDILRILEASRKDFILVETVGAGQDEVFIADLVDTCIVVLMPTLGDEIQILKAGLMEIGDIYVLNKSDLGDTEKLKEEIKGLWRNGYLRSNSGWVPPVVETVAVKDKGCKELANEVLLHKSDLEKSGELEARRKKRIRDEVVYRVQEKIGSMVENLMKNDDRVGLLVEEIHKKERDPYSAVEVLVEMFFKGSGR